MFKLRRSLDVYVYIMSERQMTFFEKNNKLVDVVVLQSGNRKEVLLLEIIVSFFVSVLASIAGYYICKWLDGDDGDN